MFCLCVCANLGFNSHPSWFVGGGQELHLVLWCQESLPGVSELQGEVRTFVVHCTNTRKHNHMYVIICFDALLSCRLLLYGRYCSQVEAATKQLDSLSNMREDIRMKLEVRNFKN